MSSKHTVTELAFAFSALTVVGKSHVLASAIHMLTIYVRAHHADNPEDAMELARYNEVVHRLAGHAVRILSKEPFGQQDVSIVSWIIEEGRIPLERLSAWIADGRLLHRGAHAREIG